MKFLVSMRRALAKLVRSCSVLEHLSYIQLTTSTGIRSDILRATTNYSSS